MTKQSITVLALLVALLAAVYFVGGSDSSDSTQGSERLLAEIDVDRIASIKIEQNENEIELALGESGWTIPSRAHYSANPSKVRSLLLKVLDLSSSQRLPASEKGVAKLGLTEEALKIGRARIRLYDKNGKELDGLFLGDVRKTNNDTSRPTAGPNTSGQYVRRTSGGDIFLVGLPVIVSTELSNWLNAELVNVLRSSLVEVEQFAKVDDRFVQQFALGIEDEQAVELVGSVPEGKEPQAAMISSIASGLENVSIIDVAPAAAEEIQDLVFDRKTEFSTNSGAVYEVWTAEKDAKFFARIVVRSDDELVELLKNDAAVAAATAKSEETATTESNETSQEPETTEDALKIISDEEVQSLNEKFSQWVYTLAEFQAAKFRRTRGELLQEIKSEDTAEVGKQAIENAGG